MPQLHPPHFPQAGQGLRRWRAPLLAMAGLCACLAAVQAQTQAQAQTQTQEVETDGRSQAVAQKVLGILGYTRWPQEPAVVRLCVLGPTEYADELLKGGKLPSGRPVQVRRMRFDDPLLPAECDAVYAGTVSGGEWRELLFRVAGQPLLSISERKSLCSVGAMFCLDVLGSSVAFEVNLDSLARSGVRVNPRVLQLARRKGVL